MTLSKHNHDHSFKFLNPLEREGLVFSNRRNFIKAGIAGMGGLTLPGLLRQRADAANAGKSLPGKKAVILLWMAGALAKLIVGIRSLIARYKIAGLSQPSPLRFQACAFANIFLNKLQ